MSNLKTLVVDTSYMARAIIDSSRAFVINYKGNAEILQEYDEYFRLADCNDLKIKKPSIIKVFTYINHGHRVPLTRKNIFRRDEYKCVYCGDTDKSILTLDHVIPQSKGGGNSWTNLVTACLQCNSDKRDLTLEEFGKPDPKPRRPHYLMLMRKVKDIPKEWKPFLFLE